MAIRLEECKMPDDSRRHTKSAHGAARYREQELARLYDEYFTPPEVEDRNTPFKMVSMFGETDNVFVTNYSVEIKEKRFAELE